MNQHSVHRPIITAVLSQHLEDAAYLWSHRSNNLWSPFFYRHDILRLDFKLDANLEGIRISGPQSIGLASINLARWQSPAESFVLSYAIAHTMLEDPLQALEKQLEKTPELANGAAAALLWSSPTRIQGLIDRWIFSNIAALRQAAIPAALIHPQLDMEKFIKRSIDDSSPGVRARAYRAIGEWQLLDFKKELQQGALKEKNIICQSEAATALALLGDTRELLHLPKAFSFLSGTHLQRFLLIWSSLSTLKDFEHWFVQHKGKKEYYRQLIWALIYRGDGIFLPRIKRFLENDIETILCGYAVAHITGIDLEDENLCLIENDNSDNVQSANDSLHVEDAGLPAPDSKALIDWLNHNAGRFSPGERYAAGTPLQLSKDELFVSGSQPQRWQAALQLTIEGAAGKMPSLLQANV